MPWKAATVLAGKPARASPALRCRPNDRRPKARTGAIDPELTITRSNCMPQSSHRQQSVGANSRLPARVRPESPGRFLPSEFYPYSAPKSWTDVGDATMEGKPSDAFPGPFDARK